MVKGLSSFLSCGDPAFSGKSLSSFPFQLALFHYSSLAGEAVLADSPPLTAVSTKEGQAQSCKQNAVLHQNTVLQSPGDFRGGGTPGPISNPVVKPVSTDDTAGVARWDSRPSPGAFLFFHPPFSGRCPAIPTRLGYPPARLQILIALL